MSSPRLVPPLAGRRRGADPHGGTTGRIGFGTPVGAPAGPRDLGPRNLAGFQRLSPGTTIPTQPSRPARRSSPEASSASTRATVARRPRIRRSSTRPAPVDTSARGLPSTPDRRSLAKLQPIVLFIASKPRSRTGGVSSPSSTKSWAQPWIGRSLAALAYPGGPGVCARRRTNEVAARDDPGRWTATDISDSGINRPQRRVFGPTTYARSSITLSLEGQFHEPLTRPRLAAGARRSGDVHGSGWRYRPRRILRLSR